MLRIFDTAKKDVVEFKPLYGNNVGMYVCGVTVYDHCHIGHARSAVNFDIIFRYLKFKGYNVKFVKNFTDVDDKIIKRANDEKVSCENISTRYIEEYYKDMDAIGIERPVYEPKATEHIAEIINIVKTLIDKGYAYEVDGDVYYRVDKFKEYGKLSHKNIDELKSGARIEVNDKKDNPLDFALWKKSKQNEPAWESPWGMGRPGWHIECSAMSMKYLGETFDIHGGGEDLIFPHHENEIAQSEAATGKQFVKYWIHNAFVKINKEKMSKSLGNFFTIKDILKQFRGETLRYFLLLTHYRSPIDFSFEGLQSAKEALNRYYNFIKRLEEGSFSETEDSMQEKVLKEEIDGLLDKFEEAMDDDFNTPKAIGEVFKIIKSINVYLDDYEKNSIKPAMYVKKKFLSDIEKIYGVLGVFNASSNKWFYKDGVDVEFIESKIKERNEARKIRDFKKADAIRDELAKIGIVLEDSAGSTKWKIKN